MSRAGNHYLDHQSSDDSGADDGYDSEAAELSRNVRSRAVAATSRRSTKRRKLSHDEQVDSDEKTGDVLDPIGRRIADAKTSNNIQEIEGQKQRSESESTTPPVNAKENGKNQPAASSKSTAPSVELSKHTPPRADAGNSTSKTKEKDRDKRSTTPGVIYLSSLPPYLKPSALRNLLQQRGFHPISRLFLTPASKSKSATSSSRQRYTEGWIEFSSKKTARRCAETLNARPVGGKKGGFYHDDIWNMKYLRGLGWDELMAGVREERREEESRRDEERRVVAGETKRYLEGVEMGKRDEGMKNKQKMKKRKKTEDGRSLEGEDEDVLEEPVEVKRTWRQFEVKGRNGTGQNGRGKEKISDEAKEVLSKIF